jgi:hypothetical protein
LVEADQYRQKQEILPVFRSLVTFLLVTRDQWNKSFYRLTNTSGRFTVLSLAELSKVKSVAVTEDSAHGMTRYWNTFFDVRRQFTSMEVFKWVIDRTDAHIVSTTARSRAHKVRYKAWLRTLREVSPHDRDRDHEGRLCGALDQLLREPEMRSYLKAVSAARRAQSWYDLGSIQQLVEFRIELREKSGGAEAASLMVRQQTLRSFDQKPLISDRQLL